MSMSYPARTAFFCSSILLRSSSVMVCFTVLMALFWSMDWMCMVTIWLESMSRMSASIRSLMSEAVMDKNDMAPYISPTWKVRRPLKAKAAGAMKSFTDSPDSTSHFHSKAKGSRSPMWNMECIRRRRSFPFSTVAVTPMRLKLLSRSVSTWSSRGLACRMDAASMPKVRYFALVRPLLPLASWLFSIWLYSARTLSNASPAGGMRTDFSKLSASVAMFMKDSSKWMELSKKLRKLHHSSKMAVLSSCWASW